VRWKDRLSVHGSKNS